MKKILLVKNYEDAKRLADKDTTIAIEAVYGDKLVWGSLLTLDHHTDVLDDAPALYDGRNLPEDIYDATIILSHVDLDVIAGLLNIYHPGELTDAEKESINFIDCNGQHHIDEVKETSVIDRYNGIVSTFRLPFSKEPITDVTEYVVNLVNMMKSKDKASEYEAKGLQIRDERQEYAEKHLWCTMPDCAFIVSNDTPMPVPFGLNSCYKIRGQEFKMVLVYSDKFGSLTLSSCNPEINAKDIMQKHFGDEAGGHPGIAGTPRGKRYTIEDGVKLLDAMFTPVYA